MAAPQRRAADVRRPLHHHKARALEVLDKPPCDDLRHDLVGVVDALAAMEAQGEGERGGEIVTRGRRKLIGVGHGLTVARQ